MSDNLSLYVKHLAWLYTAPDGRGVTRIEQFKDTLMTQLPDITGGEYIISLLGDMGYAQAGEPLSATELASWSSVTGIELDGWTAALILKLSKDFVSQKRVSGDDKLPAPYYP